MCDGHCMPAQWMLFYFVDLSAVITWITIDRSVLDLAAGGQELREEICAIIDGENTTACIVETVLE